MPTAIKYLFRDLLRIDIATFQHDVYTVCRSTISTAQRQPTNTSNCSTAKCDVFSTYTLRSRRGLEAPDVTAVSGCPSRHVTLNEVVVNSSVASRWTLAVNDKANCQAARAAAPKAIAQSRSDAIIKRFADIAGDHAATWRVTRDDVLHRGKQLLWQYWLPFIGGRFQPVFLRQGALFTEFYRRQRTSTYRPTLYEYDTPARTSGLQGLNFHEWQVDSWRSAQGFVIDAYQSSPFDLLPSSLLHQSTGIFAPVLAHMANLSLIECSFPPAFKTAQVLPILKKSVLDAAVLSNFRPISNLPTFDLVTRLNCNITVRFDRHLWSWFFSQTLFICIICYRQRESIVTCEIVVTPMNSRSIVLTCIKSLLLFNHCICTFDFFKHLWVVF